MGWLRRKLINIEDEWRLKNNFGFRYLSFSPDQGYGSALSMAPFSSATEQYSDVADKVRLLAKLIQRVCFMLIFRLI